MVIPIFGRFPKSFETIEHRIQNLVTTVSHIVEEEVLVEPTAPEQNRVELWVQDSSGTLVKQASSSVDKSGHYTLHAPKAQSLHVFKDGEKLRPSAAFPALASRFGLDAIEHQIRAAGVVGEKALQDLEDTRKTVDALVREVVTHEPAASAIVGQNPHKTHATAELRFFSDGKEVQRKPFILSPFEDAVHEVEEFDRWWSEDHNEPWDYDPAWPFPRRLAAQQSLLDPRNSVGWEMQFFARISDRNYNGCIYKFLYPEDRPKAFAYLGVEPPLLKTAADYQQLFVANQTMIEKRRSRTSAFFVERLLGGMYPVFFKREDSPEGERIVSEFNWDTRDFGPIYDGSDVDDGRDPAPYPGDAVTSALTGKGYDLPNVRAICREVRRVGGDEPALALEKIEIQFRKDGQRTAVAGMNPADAFDSLLTVSPDDDANRWQWACRLYRTSYLLAGEIEAHIGRGHLVTEQYLLACERAFRRNPVGELLAPFLWQVDKINNFGNPLIFGGRGILSRASALTPDALTQALTDHLGTVDWFQWTSREPTYTGARYARVAKCFERVVRDEVDAFFDAHRQAIVEHWPEAVLFSDELLAHSVSFQRYQNPDARWISESEFAPVKDRDDVEREVGRSRAMSPIRTIDDLKQCCVHAIFYATFWHSWVNDNQQIDGGEVNYAAMGIRTKEPPPLVSEVAAAFDAWEQSVAPTGTHVVFQLVNADLLPNTNMAMS